MLHFISRLCNCLDVNIIEGPDSQEELHELRRLISGKYTNIQCTIKFSPECYTF